jgi:hypothetical protein
MVAIHAMTAGTDSGNPVFRIVTFALIGILTVLTAHRFVSARRGAHGERTRPALADRLPTGAGPSRPPAPASDPYSEVR